MKKKYLIIGSVLLVYVIMMVVIFGTDLFKNKTYIMIGTEEKLKYDSGEYVDIKASEKDLYQGKIYDIYDLEGHVGENTLKYHEGRWHAFDENYKFIKLNNPIFAIKSNKKYSVPEYKVQELDNEDMVVLNDILKEKNISNYNLSVNQKVIIDLDGDGTEEKLYAVSNLFEDEDADGYFSLVYYIENNKIKMLKEKYYIDEDPYNGELYKITKLVDLKDNQKMEIVVTRVCYSLVCDKCSEIYTLKWGKYKSLRTCE